jgi:hypothetical protein
VAKSSKYIDGARLYIDFSAPNHSTHILLSVLSQRLLQYAKNLNEIEKGKIPIGMNYEPGRGLTRPGCLIRDAGSGSVWGVGYGRWLLVGRGGSAGPRAGPCAGKVKMRLAGPSRLIPGNTAQSRFRK